MDLIRIPRRLVNYSIRIGVVVSDIAAARILYVVRPASSAVEGRLILTDWRCRRRESYLFEACGAGEKAGAYREEMIEFAFRIDGGLGRLNERRNRLLPETTSQNRKTD